MSDTKVFSLNDGNSGGSVPAWLPFLNGNGGGLFGGNGWGGGILGFFLGLLFGNGGFFGNGFGGFGGGNGAGFLANQINNDNGRDLLMQAITSSGQRSQDAIQTLSTMLGQDFNLVNSSIQAIASSLNTIAANQGMNAMQVINAIQGGNAALASQFAQCCCENRLGLANLGAGIDKGFAEVNGNIAAKSAEDRLAVCQQTYTLKDGADANTRAIIGKLDAMQTQALQDKLDAARAENTKLAGEISQANQNNVIAGMIANAVNPLAGQLAGIRSEVDAIKRCQPPTITLPNNQYTAVPTLYANAAADFIASYWANRLSGATTPATDATTPAA